MTPQETFVTRLRRNRQRCRVSLDEIATETRIKKEMLEALENNDLSAWPKGLFARAWIRMYASAVGLDPGDTVDEFCRLFPQGDRRARGTIHDMASIVAAPPVYRDEFPHEERRGVAPPPEVEPPQARRAPVPQGIRAVWGRVVSWFVVPAIR